MRARLRFCIPLVSIIVALFIFNPIITAPLHASEVAQLNSQGQITTSATLLNNVRLTPSWWNGYQCDSNHYNNDPNNPNHVPAVPLANPPTSYRGEVACGPMPLNYNPRLDVPVNFYSDAPTENEWECTELVKRYLYQAFGTPDLGNTNGYQVVDNYQNALLQKYPNNGTPNVLPVMGDVLSFAELISGDGGHTAIVTAVHVNTRGVGTISILEQNNTNDPQGTGTLHVGSWKYNSKNPAWVIDTERDSSSSHNPLLGTVTGWLHPNTLVTSQNLSQYTNQLFAVTTASTTGVGDVWAVGYGQTPQGPINTLIEYWNGSMWQIISSPDLGVVNYLYGVAALSQNDIWAVGEYKTANGSAQTLLEHWDGTQWAASTQGSGVLYAITKVSSTEAWAVGASSDGGTTPTELTMHLVKGTWTLVTDPTVDVTLSAVSASSPTNIWAVGTTSVDTNKTVVLQWTGGPKWTVMSNTPNPGTNNILYGVAVINSSNVWVTGAADNTPFVVEWTASSGWGQPTFFQGGVAAITALSAKNIWVVGGSASNGTNIEHYDGKSWSQIPTNIGNTHSGFAGITINPKNGNVWVVGVIIGNNNFWQTLTAFYN